MAKIKIGSLLVNERTFVNQGKEVKKNLVSVALGNVKNKDPKYNLSVTLIVKDSTGKVVHQQENGYINLVDPRLQPDELLAAGLITEDQALTKKQQLLKLPDMVKYNLEIPLKS